MISGVGNRVWYVGRSGQDEFEKHGLTTKNNFSFVCDHESSKTVSSNVMFV